MRNKGKELPMRVVREIIRQYLLLNIRSNRKIARSCGTSHTVVNKYIQRILKSGLDYEVFEKMNDEEIKKSLYPEKNCIAAKYEFTPNWEYIHKEMKKKNVTLFLLWNEYREQNPSGYGQTSFYNLYREWNGKQEMCFRCDHKAGEKMFVDYAGHTIPIVNRETGEIREAQIFVSVLGASNYTYAEATWTQKQEDWISSHVRTFEYFEGIPEIVVNDNLKSGTKEADRYEPEINPSYNDMARHYGIVVIPTRVRKPKDKAKAEVAVQITERWILAALRNRTFFSLEELNAAIRELLLKLNTRPFKKLEGSRQELFEKIEKPVLKKLPAEKYRFSEWKRATVNIDYHIELFKHYYSVPFKFYKKSVEVRSTENTVEIFRNGQRIACHKRNNAIGRHTTLKEHMPKNHREYVEWTPERIIHWASKFGKSTEQIVNGIMKSRPHPIQAYRSCLGVIRLERHYGAKRLEAACTRALPAKAYSYKSIKSILMNGLDKEISLFVKPELKPINHENIRGKNYFNQEGKFYVENAYN